MKSFLPIAWFVLAGFILLGNLGVVQYVWLQDAIPGMAISRLPLVLSSILTTLAFGAAYLVIAKVTRLIVPVVFGWIQLIAYTLAQAAGIWAFYLQFQFMSQRDTTDMSDFALANGVQMGFFTISALFFFAAMLSAAVTLPSRASAQDFD